MLGLCTGWASLLEITLFTIPLPILENEKMTTTIHQATIDLCLARCSDRRIRRPATAIRWLKIRGLLRECVQDANRGLTRRKVGELDFRRDTLCSSGRKLNWFLPKFLQISTMIRDLRRIGYSVESARRISQSAASCDYSVWAVADQPPCGEYEACSCESYMGHWAQAKADELRVSVEHVWQWSRWRSADHGQAIVGRRTKRWIDVVNRDIAKSTTQR